MDLTKMAQREEIKRIVGAIVKQRPELNNKQAESVAVQMASESAGVGVVKMIMPQGFLESKRTGYDKLGYMNDEYLIYCVKKPGFVFDVSVVIRHPELEGA